MFSCIIASTLPAYNRIILCYFQGYLEFHISMTCDGGIAREVLCPSRSPSAPLRVVRTKPFHSRPPHASYKLLGSHIPVVATIGRQGLLPYDAHGHLACPLHRHRLLRPALLSLSRTLQPVVPILLLHYRPSGGISSLHLIT